MPMKYVDYIFLTFRSEANRADPHKATFCGRMHIYIYIYIPEVLPGRSADGPAFIPALPLGF